ncbi:unnamed protein product [Absidia cylindrospora]
MPSKNSQAIEYKDKFFIAQVSEGEDLCEKVSKVYPDPMQVLDIYLKLLPQCVFENVAIAEQTPETRLDGYIPVY